MPHAKKKSDATDFLHQVWSHVHEPNKWELNVAITLYIEEKIELPFIGFIKLGSDSSVLARHVESFHAASLIIPYDSGDWYALMYLIHIF
jgi:hypothetical protein